jgi:two-component system cell cycle response regulator
VVSSAVMAGIVGWLLAGGFAAPIRRALAQSERSREELRRSLSRLGQTLSSSLDLGRTLSVVVETAMATLGADRAVLMLLTPERDALYAKVGRGVGTRVPSVRMGHGLAGWVAYTGKPLRLPADVDRAPVPDDGEPVAAHQLLVPLLGRGQVIGVLSLLRDGAARPFTQLDLDTITSFTAQASVAIENVLLHREAQRLAVTDPLTGLWNFRYFQIQADRELESAMRFERPLSLVIVDLDHFKEINDGLGHQVGDEVLTEVARRIRDMTRVPDVVARYGGEEFVVLLPGAARSGALAMAERIRQAVGSQLITVCVNGQPISPVRITCSAGVASFPADGQTVAALLRSADAAMYVAKTRGRNQVVAAGNAVLSEIPWHANPSAPKD